MTLACPQCKSAISRERQRFCYRCGHDLRVFYDSLNAPAKEDSLNSGTAMFGTPHEARPPRPSTVTGEQPVARETGEQSLDLDTLAIDPVDLTAETAPASGDRKATLRILLPTGDVFDKELASAEAQVGKGPRNDIVIADPAVSTTHSLIKLEADGYLLTDLGSRNGTYLNGERISEPRRLNHGDVIGMGLSKLTFRLSDYSETGAIQRSDILALHSRQTPPPLTEDSLAQALSSEGIISGGEVSRLREENPGRRLYRTLIESKAVAEDKLRDLMGRVFKIPAADLSTAQVDDALAAQFPSRLARSSQVFPIAMEGNRLALAVADPTDTAVVEEAQREMNMPIDVRLATASEITRLIDRHYGPKIIGVLPSGEKLEYPINKSETEIGKAAHNHIVLTDPTVSNTHAVLLARDGGYSIVDLGSRNGTYINGERLSTRARVLRHGDAIQLGQTVFTFRNPGETTENITAVLSEDAVREIRKRAQAEPEAKAGGPTTPSPVPSGAVESPPAQAGQKHKEKAGARAEVEAPRQAHVPPPAAAAPVASAVAETQGEEEKRKKKKKKKTEEERVKAAYIRAIGGILATLLSVGLTVMLTMTLMRSNQPPPPASNGAGNTNTGGVVPARRSRFSASPTGIVPLPGGTYEASGVIQVPNDAAVLFVDDGKPRQVFYMRVDGEGRAGEIKPVPLDVKIENPEGITYGGGYFYVVSSQSDPAKGELNGLARFVFDPASQTVQGQAEVIGDLRSFLIGNVPALKGAGELPGAEGGLNIEGIAWDPVHERLILALRSPVVNDQALLVPLRLRDPRGPFSGENLSVQGPGAIPLSVGGLGIRDIHYDSRLKAFLILAGATETQKKTEFKLWVWDGGTDPSHPGSTPVEEVAIDPGMKPEGVAHLRADGKDFIFIVGDASRYLKLDYASGQ